MAKKTKKAPQELTEENLDGAAGGLLLPAVQAAREAARKSQAGFLGGVYVAAGDVNGDNAD